MKTQKRHFFWSAILAILLISLWRFGFSKRAQFVAGGALVDAGYLLQDRLHAYDFEHAHEITAEQVWAEFSEQNKMASTVRSVFPRSTEHPVVAMLVCMDARIDTNELAGDTRRYYYVLRSAGSTLLPAQEDMLELAVRNGVKVIVLTRHTDCAAEKAAKNSGQRKAYPALMAALDRRNKGIEEFLERPLVAERIKKGELLVKQMLIDTRSDILVPDDK